MTQVTAFLVRAKQLVPALIGFILIGCGGLSEHDRRAIEQALSDSTHYATETWNVTMDIMQDQRRFIRITSPFATTIETPEGGETTLKGPLLIHVRDSLGAVETEVTAMMARYQNRRGEFFLQGDVVVTTLDEQVLKTEELTWFQQERSIQTDAFVTIVTPRDSITGHGLRGDDRLQEYVIERVTGRFTIDTERPSP